MTPFIGAQLKQIRESRGIALDEIAHKTHISLAYLQAIEDGDVESLPSKVQLRGFLRLYANELGVKLDDLSVSDDQRTTEKQALSRTDKVAQAEKPDTPEITEDEQEIDLKSEIESEDETEPATEVEFESSTPPPDNIQSVSSIETDDLKASAEIFQAIGAKIKSRRELLSISIKDVHKNTHIGEQYLTAIEAGKLNNLPSPVQAKGMLVNYAEFLNMDTDALLREYTDALQIRRIEKQAQIPKKRSRSGRELSPTALRLKNFFSIDLLVILGLFITLSIFVIWGVNRILATDTPQGTEDDIPGVSDVLLATDTPTPVVTVDPEMTEIIEDEEGETETEEEPLFTPIVSTDPINIILVPRQRLWVRVTVDEEIVFQGRLLPGNAYDYSGQERVDILTGNAGALQILFNNEDIGSAGLIGQVANLSFTEDGLVLPPPTSTPTITETPITTPTPTATPTEIDDQTN